MDWLDFSDKDAVRKELEAGPKDLEPMGEGLWGIRGIGVICAGDIAHMRKVQAKRFADKFYARPCPMGRYTTTQLENWKTVAERLAT